MRRLLLVIVFLLYAASAGAATLFAKTAGGNWTAATTWSNVNAGGADNSGPPLSTDTCIFELLSGNVTVDTGAVCGSMSQTAGTGSYTGTLTHTAAVTLAISGSVTFSAGSTYTLNNAATSALSILATGTLTTAGKTIGNLTMVNVTLGDALASSGTAITLTSGSFTAGGFGVTANGAGTVTITGSFTGANSFAALTRNGTATKTDGLTLTGALACTVAFAATGNSDANRLIVQSNTLGTARTLTAAVSSTNANVDFADIAAAGTGIPFTGTLLGDALGNTNITFSAPTTQTHTASSGGSWSDSTKWTSRVPLPQDSVIVDANTTGTLTRDMPRMGANLTFTGFAGTLAHNGIDTSIYGSLILGAGMTWQNNTFLAFRGRSSHTVTTNGVLFGRLTVAAIGGTYTQLDALTGANGNDSFAITDGTWDTGNFALTIFTFNSNTGCCTTRGMTGGSSTITLLSNSGTVASMGPTATAVSCTACTWAIAVASASSRTFAGGGGTTIGALTYTVAGSSGALVITGANTFSAINFSDATTARTITFPASSTTTMTGAFNVRGTATATMSIISSSGGTAATLSKAANTGNVSTDYLSIKDSTATGGATWCAGANSTSVSGNSGWVFAACPGSGSLLLLGVGN